MASPQDIADDFEYLYDRIKDHLSIGNQKGRIQAAHVALSLLMESQRSEAETQRLEMEMSRDRWQGALPPVSKDDGKAKP